jgi:DmsE family decaheme c-type cytochrome
VFAVDGIIKKREQTMKDLRHTLQYLLAGIALAVLSAAVMPIALAADKDLVLRDDAKCTKCHDEADAPNLLHIGQTRHGVRADGRTPSCTNCHGESANHIKGGSGSKDRPKPDVLFNGKGKSEASAQNASCLTCHESGGRTHWSGSKHQSEDLSCGNCHTVHAPRDKVLAKATQPEVCFACHKTVRAETHRISTHPLAAGKIGCSDCHNPHGSVGPKQLVGNSVNETCWSCHAEKRGPFLFDHPSASDDCMNCHTPHGSTNAPLLKARSPWLCQQCHSGTTPHPGNVYSANMLPGGAIANANVATTNVNPVTGAPVARNNPAAQLAYRACSNCHSAVHGSNHPAGLYLLR